MTRLQENRTEASPQDKVLRFDKPILDLVRGSEQSLKLDKPASYETYETLEGPYDPEAPYRLPVWN